MAPAPATKKANAALAKDDPKWTPHRAARENLPVLQKIQNAALAKSQYLRAAFIGAIDRASLRAKEGHNPDKTGAAPFHHTNWLQPAFLTRFLRASKNDAGEAEKMVGKMVEWREKMGLDDQILNLDYTLKMMQTMSTVEGNAVEPALVQRNSGIGCYTSCHSDECAMSAENTFLLQ